MCKDDIDGLKMLFVQMNIRPSSRLLGYISSESFIILFLLQNRDMYEKCCHNNLIQIS